MAKWSGLVGFAENVEIEPGLSEERIITHKYRGDFFTQRWNHNGSNNVNTNTTLLNVISIVANPYASKNCQKIVYAEYKGVKWKVTTIDPSSFPRIALTLGGVYTDVEQTQTAK